MSVSTVIRRLRNLGKLFGLNALAIASFLLLTLSPIPWVGFITAAFTIAVAWRRHWKSGMGKAVSVRILMTAGLIAQYVPNLRDTNDYALLATTALLVMLIMHEGLVHRTVSRAKLGIANLPGFAARTSGHVNPQNIFHANTAMIVLLGAFAVARLPSWPLTAATVLLCLGVGYVLLDARKVYRRNDRTWTEFTTALEAYGPAFAVYFSGPPGVLYQISMWMPYFEKLGKRFVVVLREGHAIDEISKMTSAPIVHCSTIASLDKVAVEGLHAADRKSVV